jgi:hypothetical protein
MFLLERSSTGNLPGSLVLQRTASCAVSAARASVNPGNDYSGVPYRSSRRPRRAVRRERQGAPGKVRVRWERLVGRPGRRTRARGDARGSGARSGRRRAWISRTSDRGSGPESMSSASMDASTGRRNDISSPRFPSSNPTPNCSAPKKPAFCADSDGGLWPNWKRRRLSWHRRICRHWRRSSSKTVHHRDRSKSESD